LEAVISLAVKDFWAEETHKYGKKIDSELSLTNAESIFFLSLNSYKNTRASCLEGATKGSGAQHRPIGSLEGSDPAGDAPKFNWQSPAALFQ
jgi:hypothetical protein